VSESPVKVHQPCPNPDCGSSDAYSEWANGAGYCHSCETKFPPLRDETYNKREPMEKLKTELRSYRGIQPKVVEKYEVETALSEAGEETRRVYKYPSGTKYRYLDKKSFSWASGGKPTTLFGMDKFNAGSSKSITIVEGEDDALAAYYMLGGQHPVVSLPSGTISEELLKGCFDYLDAFKEIVVATDNDKVGDKAATRISLTFPNKTYRVSLTKHKDACDYLAAGDKADFKFAWINRKKYVPDNILNTPDQFIDLFENTPEHQYTPTGIVDLDSKILGIMKGMLTVVKAPTGIGKTEFMRYLEYKFLKDGVRLAAWHLEETKLRSLLGLVSYEGDDNLTRKDLIEDKGKQEEVKAAITTLTGDENFYQFFLRDGDGTEELIDQIRYFATVCEVDYIFFEPIQDVLGNSEELLAQLAIRLSKLAAELNVGIVTIAHTNEDNEIKYCRMIGQRAAVIMSLDRDPDAPTEEERNVTKIRVEKNRPCSHVGWGGMMKFDPETFTMEEYNG